MADAAAEMEAAAVKAAATATDADAQITRKTRSKNKTMQSGHAELQLSKRPPAVVGGARPQGGSLHRMR